MNRTCKVCKEEIPPARIKILPNTQTCVSCSTDQPYVAVNVTHGHGDHTWNDIQILTQEKYQEFERLKNEYSGKVIPKNEEEEFDFSKSSKKTVDESKEFNNLLNEDSEVLDEELEDFLPLGVEYDSDYDADEDM
jgi:hypothetical protein